jgi:signal transduction histidine kinase
MQNRYILIAIFLVVISSFYISNEYISDIKRDFQNKDIEKNTNLQKKELQQLIDLKSKSTLSLAIALSKSSDVIEALYTTNPINLTLDKLSKELHQKTEYRSIWFHIVTGSGISLYKSWIDKKYESILHIRPDLKKALETKKLINTISVGKFSMTFKSIVPVVDDGRFLGIIEVISHFDNIVDSLRYKNIDSIVLADKRYKKQLTMSKTNKFIDDYYMVNLNSPKELIEKLRDSNLDKYIKNRYFFIEDNKIVSKFDIKNSEKETIGYFLMFRDFDSLNYQEINDFINIIKVTHLALIALVVLIYIVYYLKNRKQQIQQMNSKLQEMVDEKIKENEKQRQELFAQQKKGAMGDLIGIIAHQLKQPLNSISLTKEIIIADYEDAKIDDRSIEYFDDSISKQVSFMSRSIDDLRNFFRPDKKPMEFSVKDAIEKAVAIIYKSIHNKGIEVEIDIQKDSKIVGIETELEQVIINLVTNAKDVLVQRKIENPYILIQSFIKDTHIIITVQDNGGGVDKSIINNIFDLYFTTKGESGTGIGLNLAKMIVKDSMSGDIFAKNSKDGAVFVIELPIEG